MPGVQIVEPKGTNSGCQGYK